MELDRRAYEQGHDRRQSLDEHDELRRLAHADVIEHQVTRDYEQHVADEQKTCAWATGGIAEAGIALELQLRDANVDAIELAKDVAEHQRQDARRNPAIGRVLLRLVD